MRCQPVQLPLGIIQRAADSERKQKVKAAVTPAEIYLPGFTIGVLPNHLNRSSIIAPIAHGSRKCHHRVVMVSRKDCILEYTGEQLDEADGDIIMALIFFSYSQPLGTRVLLNRAELLRKIERSTGKRDYEWLHSRMRALTEATLYVETKHYKIDRADAFHILRSFEFDNREKSYVFTLDPRWIQMFSRREYTRIDWEARMQIHRGQDMAKTVQRLVATDNKPEQRYKLMYLKEKMLYSGRWRDFRDALLCAGHELERVGVISRSFLEMSTRNEEQLVVQLPAPIDWDKRAQIGYGQGLARKLQIMFGEHEQLMQVHSLKRLQARTGHRGESSEFSDELIGALRELERVGVIESFCREKNKKDQDQLSVRLSPLSG
jgi:hypothetical protein